MKDRISALREAKGYTLKEFSDRMGISLTGLSGLIRGQNPVKERHIRLILAAFPDVSETWLRTGEGPMFKPEGVDEELEKAMDSFSLPVIARHFIRAYDRAPKHMQDEIDAYLRSVLDELQGDSQETYIRTKTAEYEKKLREELEAEKGVVSA